MLLCETHKIQKLSMLNLTASYGALVLILICLLYNAPKC